VLSVLPESFAPGGRAGFESRYLTVHAGLERRDAFQAPGLSEVIGWPPLPPVPETTYFVGDVTVNLGPLALSGWYADPVSGAAAAFEPPSHSRTALTFRSKFLRTFRSGAFDLKVQIALEAWGDGSAGGDGSGAPLPLAGTSVAEAFLQVELVSFHAFWSLKNALRSAEGFVPRFEYPRNLQTFGMAVPRLIGAGRRRRAAPPAPQEDSCRDPRRPRQTARPAAAGSRSKSDRQPSSLTRNSGCRGAAGFGRWCHGCGPDRRARGASPCAGSRTRHRRAPCA
jgi:hypothetical protein